MGIIVAIPFLMLGVFLILKRVVWNGMGYLKGVIDKAESEESGKEKYFIPLYALLFGGTALLAFPLFRFFSLFLKPTHDLKIFSAVIGFIFLLSITLIAKYKRF